MRTTIFRSSSLMVFLAGALVAPALLCAQASDTTRMYVVRAGDTLWRIAQETLGDGGRWREILQLNPTAIPAPDRLETGARLRLPGRLPRSAEPAVPPQRQVEMDTLTPPAGVPAVLQRSVFFQEKQATVPTPAPRSLDSLGVAPGEALMSPSPAVRTWEFVSSPFVVDDAALRGAGRCLSIDGATQGPVRGASSAVRLSDRIAIRPPVGVAAEVDVRLLIARPGPALADLGRLVTPTGIARVARAAETNAAPIADIVAQFDTLSCGDLLLPLEMPASPSGARVVPVANGPVGSVAWVASTALLPSLQHRVVINLGVAAGLQPGDQVTLFAPARGDSSGLGARPIAVATVLRVGARASTAVIIQQTRASIDVGTRVRVTAKLP